MGKPKHGKDKWCAKYKAECRREKHKDEKQAKINAGKKIKGRRMKKTWIMKWDDLIRNTPQSKPYVDSGGVHWGLLDKR